MDKFRNNEFRCTGSILTKNSILTAAHCLTNISLPIFINGKKYTIDQNIIYPTYGKNYSYLDDIAIIKLTEDIDPKDFHPVTLYLGEITPKKAKLVGRSTFITSPYPDYATAILKILARNNKYGLSNIIYDYIKGMPVLKSSLKNSENVSFTVTTYRSQSRNKKNGPALFYNNLKGGPLPGDSGSPLFMEDKNETSYKLE
ncbi:MAG: trypsin-like serine protease [Candidatus Caldatribacteriota bacterium]